MHRTDSDLLPTGLALRFYDEIQAERASGSRFLHALSLETTRQSSLFDSMVAWIFSSPDSYRSYSWASLASRLPKPWPGEDSMVVYFWPDLNRHPKKLFLPWV